jgi:hypothetical protein
MKVVKTSIDEIGTKVSTVNSSLAEHIARLPEKISFHSTILRGPGSILDGFTNYRNRLLYRGSRDGLQALEFHRCCDNSSYTKEMIEMVKGSIFGDFTPCCWTSHLSGEDGFDESGRSFIFTLKNPSRLPAQKFSLDRSKRAIYCNKSFGSVCGSNVIFSFKGR